MERIAAWPVVINANLGTNSSLLLWLRLKIRHVFGPTILCRAIEPSTSSRYCIAQCLPQSPPEIFKMAPCLRLEELYKILWKKYEIMNCKSLKTFGKYCFVDKNNRVIFLIRNFFCDNMEVWNYYTRRSLKTLITLLTTLRL